MYAHGRREGFDGRKDSTSSVHLSLFINRAAKLDVKRHVPLLFMLRAMLEIDVLSEKLDESSASIVLDTALLLLRVCEGSVVFVSSCVCFLYSGLTIEKCVSVENDTKDVAKLITVKLNCTKLQHILFQVINFLVAAIFLSITVTLHPYHLAFTYPKVNRTILL